jgi:hypothetical protein
MAALRSGVDASVLTTGTAAANTLTLNYTPAHSRSLLFAGFTHNNFGSGAMTTPSGWTLLGQQSFASGGRCTYLFVKENLSTSASSVTGTASAATGFAGGVVEIDGVAFTPSVAAGLTNVGTNSGTNWGFPLAALTTGAAGTAFPNPNGCPYVAVSAYGAGASLAAVIPSLGGSNAQYSYTGAATSTSIAVGATANTTGPDVSYATQYIAWLNQGATNRTAGVVSILLVPYAQGLPTAGVGG